MKRESFNNPHFSHKVLVGVVLVVLVRDAAPTGIG